MSNVSGMDVLALLEIIRNEELYTKRIDEIKQAEKSLGEARFIAATVEQANKYRDEAADLKRQAVELKLRVEEEVKALKDKNDEEISVAKTKLEVERGKVTEAMREAREMMKMAKEQNKANELEFLRLRKYDTELCGKEAKHLNEYRDFMTKLAQAKEILNG